MRMLWTHHRDTSICFPLRRPSSRSQIAERCSAARVRCAAANDAAPLPPARRSAQQLIATGGSAGNQMLSSFFVLRKTRTRWQ
jgi:hypothetical protein